MRRGKDMLSAYGFQTKKWKQRKNGGSPDSHGKAHLVKLRNMLCGPPPGEENDTLAEIGLRSKVWRHRSDQ